MGEELRELGEVEELNMGARQQSGRWLRTCVLLVNTWEANDRLHSRTTVSHDVSLKSIIGEGFGVIHHPRAPAHIAQDEDDDGAHPGRFLDASAGDEPQGSEDNE